MKNKIISFLKKRDLKIKKLTTKIDELKEIINQKDKQIELAEKRASKNIKMARQISRDFNEYELQSSEEIEELKMENRKLKKEIRKYEKGE